MSSDAQALQAALRERTKPVKLQVNIFAGTWKDVVRFDAADEVASGQVMKAAEVLASCAWKGRSRFRISKDDPMLPTEPMLEFVPGEGWNEVRHA